MASRNLPNYIRRHRKRLGFSQGDISFLLGWNDKSQPSRYEHFYRTPELSTALALAHIFKVPIDELFSGEREKAEGVVRKRAEILKTQLQHENPDPDTLRKLAVLNTITTPDETGL